MISNLTNIIKISAGSYHSLVLSQSGQVFSFGLNNVSIFIKKVWNAWS
jgi:alpha-tubulin suppressor-like RCC1 family protein